jgi:hypothetical protein
VARASSPSTRQGADTTGYPEVGTGPTAGQPKCRLLFLPGFAYHLARVMASVRHTLQPDEPALRSIHPSRAPNRTVVGAVGQAYNLDLGLIGYLGSGLANVKSYSED